jgi:hypothetical protein
VEDACAAGSCVAGAAADCSAQSDQCNAGTCQSLSPDAFTCVADPAPLEGEGCDDGEACTLPDVCTEGACGGPTYPLCEQPQGGLVCLLSGAAGATVACDLQLARASVGSPAPVAAQFDLSWQPSAATLVTFSDGQKCFPGGPCIPYTIPGNFQALQSGHSVSIEPKPLSAWAGLGHVILVNTQTADAELTDAYLDGPVVVGDPILMKAEFQLTQSIDPANPVPVFMTNIVLSQKDPLPLQSEILYLLVRSYVAP